jgi:hypothetical protein
MVADNDSDGFTNHTWYLSAKNQTDNSTYFLPFIPGRFNLDNMSLSLNATHPANNETEYNVHSLFGHMESKVTRDFLLNDTVGPNPKKTELSLSVEALSLAQVFIPSIGLEKTTELGMI